MALNQVGLERLNTATTKKIGTSKNLIINGAQFIAQRGTSSTSDGYATVDRFRANIGGNDENPTQSQGTVASNVTPYTLGFRKSFKFTNGNQTSGAGSSDRVTILHRIEAQDIASSGWNYTNPNSKITLSFWCKSSVAQNFFGFLRTVDGTSQLYPFETGSLTADTWTKITKTIPGNSNLQFDNDNDQGLDIEWDIFRGTDTTGSITLNAWGAFNSSVRVPDMTSTWYTTNDATFEITGVQLEVGSVATDFEHRSFAEELALCQRYYFKLTGDDNDFLLSGFTQSASIYYVIVNFPTVMRAYPSYTGSATAARFFTDNISQDFNLNTLVIAAQATTDFPTSTWLEIDQGGAGVASGGVLQPQNAVGTLEFSAEI